MPTGGSHDYYMRQLWDWKASADVETMGPDAARAYGQMCGWTLARAHARSGDRIAIASYLGLGRLRSTSAHRPTSRAPTPSRTTSTTRS